MEKVFGFIKEWASVIFFAAEALLLLCALIVCIVQIAAKIGVFMATCGTFGSGVALVSVVLCIYWDIKDRRAR